MKKKCIVVSLILMIVFSFLGVGNIFAQQNMVIKFSMANPLEPMLSHESSTARVFKQTIEQLSNKKMTVELYPSSVLGSQDEQWNMVRRGTIHMMFASLGALSQFYKLGTVHNIPFAFPSKSVACDVLDGEFGKKTSDDILQKTGVRVVAYPEQGFMLLTNSKRPIRSPSDLNGLRIRSMSVPMHLKLFEALGARSTTVPWEEVYTALQTGVIDGQHNAITGITAAKLYEVQKYVTVTNHFYAYIYWAVNNDWLTKLSPSDKAIFDEAVRVAMAANRGATSMVLADSSGFPLLESKGVQVYTPTPVELEQFKKLALPAAEKLIQETLGEEGVRWKNFLLSEIEKAKARQGYFR